MNSKELANITRNLKKSAVFHANNFLIDHNLSPGSLDYTKFIILSRSRTGSNLLRGILNQHSKTTTFGEIFRDCDVDDTEPRRYPQLGWEHPIIPQSKNTSDFIREHPVEFLESTIFRRYPRKIQAVGFKMFYYHAQNETSRVVWDYLQNNTDIKILHLRRLNILRTLASKKKAILTDQWVNTTGTSEKNLTIELGYDECVNEFTRTRQFEKEGADFFANHDLLDIAYEDLSSSVNREVRRAQDFLDIDPEQLMPITYKQNTQSLRRLISNYSELKNKFAHTEWEAFFDE